MSNFILMSFIFVYQTWIKNIWIQKFYVLQQVNAIRNGSTATIVLVTNPRIENGAIYATEVGIIDSKELVASLIYETYTNGSGVTLDNYVFKPVEARDFICIGNATLEEIKKPLFK